MHNTEMRMAMAERCLTELRRKRERRLTAKLAVLCFILTVSHARGASAFVGIRQGYVPVLYGSTMLSEDMGGYVLVGVLAFMVVVVITVLYIRHWEMKSKTS